MTDYNETLREVGEAEIAYDRAYAAEIAKDEMLALPDDVRRARAMLATADSYDRLAAARIAAIQAKADREERWIAAHEALAFINKATAQ